MRVAVGELVVVKPGDKIPVDGVVVKGTSSVNQAPITGESMLVTKTSGDEVFAGTISEEGYLEVRAMKRSDETILSKIVQLVDEAQRKKYQPRHLSTGSHGIIRRCYRASRACSRHSPIAFGTAVQ